MFGLSFHLFRCKRICPVAKELTFATLADLVLVTHVVDPVYEGVVAAVAHGKPVTAEPDHVDVSVSAKYGLY